MNNSIKTKIKKTLSFTAWWEDHQILYQKAGVSKDIAHTIWTAAVDNVIKGMKEAYDRI